MENFVYCEVSPFFMYKYLGFQIVDIKKILVYIDIVRYITYVNKNMKSKNSGFRRKKL